MPTPYSIALVNSVDALRDDTTQLIENVVGLYNAELEELVERILQLEFQPFKFGQVVKILPHSADEPTYGYVHRFMPDGNFGVEYTSNGDTISGVYSAKDLEAVPAGTEIPDSVKQMVFHLSNGIAITRDTFLE